MLRPSSRVPGPTSQRATLSGTSIVPTLAASALLLSACGGGAISSVDDAKQATVRIVATGSFVDPSVGLQLNAAGSGSGFIIDPSGIVVTNNHVVTGAATLEAFVGGSAKGVSAKVLGVSECADLAVIDLDGEGYPYVGWYDGTIDVNLEVRAAGFPLGDPEYTLTRGIVSKASAGGETPWASVDAVIEHDARINPGNSGGPLFDNSARVVAVNYAGASDTGQFFAIAAPLARTIVEQLKQGTDVLSLGINGQAVVDEENGISGIWVASVKSGSPASKAGIKGGDIVTKLEDLVLGADGTKKVYCDILQTRGNDAVLKVEVLRYETQEVLVGEINGKELEQAFSFAQSFDDQIATGGGGAGYDSYVEITDNSGLLAMEVPAAWGQVNGSPLENGDPALSASPDLNGFFNTWGVPGVIFHASAAYASQNDNALLDSYGQSVTGCQAHGREPYQDQLYTGTFEFYSNCGGTGSGRMIVVARPADNRFAAAVFVQLVSDADLAALDQIMKTFVVKVD